MRGDETQSATAGGDATLARSGPRHAAPRKSLLSKIQAPAGKAMALAAMPTAVFIGLGLTPKLALADEKDIPFAPGPCVTRSDEPSESEKPTASKSPEESTEPSAKPSASESAGKDDDGSKDDTDTADGKQPTPGASPSASTSGTQTLPKDTAAQAPAPAPTPTKSVNPLDPLGLGDKIKDIFDGPDEQPTATPSTTAPSAPDAPSTKPSTQPSTKPSTEPSTEPSAESGGTKTGEVTDRTKDAIKDAADKAGATVEELPEKAKGLDPKKDEDIPEGAKQPFPCPTPDPQALADAKMEPGIPLLPDEPWLLESSKLTLKGLDYHGIVEVKTGSGKIKKVLKFTASEVEIKDLHQLTVHSEGLTGHVRSNAGSTSTITDGTVTMYTEELKGNLFGLIPITFSPETPPPLNVPFAIFTKVHVKQAGQFGGTLKVPGLRNTIEPS